jgi:hypothetical protein
VLLKKVNSYGDPKLYAASIVAQSLSRSQQPLVPNTVLSSNGDGVHGGLIGTLMSLLVAEKLGVNVTEPPATPVVGPAAKA